MKHSIIGVLAWAGCCLLPAGSVQGQTVVQVDSAGCTASATAAAVYCDIQEAIDAAVPGAATVIMVADGDYAAFVVYKDGITVQAAEGARPEITGEALVINDAGGIPAYIAIGASNVGVSGLAITGYTGSAAGLDAGIAVCANTTDIAHPDGSRRTTKPTISNISITGNRITDVDNIYAAGDPRDTRGYGIFINGWNCATPDCDSAAGGSVQNIDITNNTIMRNHRGIGILGHVPGLAIHANRIAGNFDAVAVAYASHGLGYYYPFPAADPIPVPAQRNWWGASDGPRGNVADGCKPDVVANGSGDYLFWTGEVCFEPWCCDAACQSLSVNGVCDSNGGDVPGDQPVLNTSGYIGFWPGITVREFKIRNSGGGTLDWSLGAVAYRDGSGWIIDIDPIAGRNEATVQVTVSRDGLAGGSYEAVIPIASNGGNGQMVVRLDVEPALQPAPALFFNIGSISASGTETDIVRSVTASNQGDAAGTWVASVAYATEEGWIELSPEALTIPAGATADLTVTLKPQALLPGRYEAVITYALAPGASDSVTIEVSLEVGAAGDPALRICRRRFFIPRWRTEAVATITNPGSGPLRWSVEPVAYSRGGEGWVRVSPDNGVLAAGDAEAVALTINRTGLPPGIYRARVPFASVAGTAEVVVWMIVPLAGQP
jgi:hypothetical protein